MEVVGRAFAGELIKKGKFTLGGKMAKWKDDAAFRKAVEGERKLIVALRIKDARRRQETLAKLKATYGDTCLAPRFR